MAMFFPVNTEDGWTVWSTFATNPSVSDGKSFKKISFGPTKSALAKSPIAQGALAKGWALKRQANGNWAVFAKGGVLGLSWFELIIIAVIIIALIFILPRLIKWIRGRF